MHKVSTKGVSGKPPPAPCCIGRPPTFWGWLGKEVQPPPPPTSATSRERNARAIMARRQLVQVLTVFMSPYSYSPGQAGKPTLIRPYLLSDSYAFLCIVLTGSAFTHWLYAYTSLISPLHQAVHSIPKTHEQMQWES